MDAGVPAYGGAIRQDISGSVTSVIVRHIRSRVGEAGVTQALAMAGDPRPVGVLEDPNSWSSHDDVIALLSATGDVTRDANIGRHIGEDILRQHQGTEVAEQLRSLGTPSEFLRNIAALGTKLSNVSTMDPLEVGPDSAVIRAVTRQGFTRHPYMCEFTKGLLSQVPSLFGLAPGDISETECQARGGRFCLYRVAWDPANEGSSENNLAPPHNEYAGRPTTDFIDVGGETGDDIAAMRQQLVRMNQQIDAIAHTANDLLALDSLSEILDRIGQRAASSVGAPRYLLVVRTSTDARIHIHQHGLTEVEMQQVAAELWKPQPDDLGGTRLIVDVASPRRAYGRLAAMYPAGQRYTDEQHKILTIYAHYAATAMDLLTALAESRAADETATALLTFSRALSRTGTIDEVVQNLADTVPSVIGCDRASVMLWDNFDQQLTFKAVSGGRLVTPPPEFTNPSDVPIIFIAEQEIDLFDDEEINEEIQADFSSFGPGDTPFVEHLINSREIMVLERNGADPFQLAVLERYGVAVSVIAPIFSDEEFLGIVAADFYEYPAESPRTNVDLKRRLGALADQAVTSLQNAWLLEQVGHMAWHDALTGLPNRRLLEDRVVQELERAKRVGETCAMFFVDLDRFKKINDTLGHASGDELIKQVSQRLRDAVRRQDTVSRLGGDEFAILLPGLSDMASVRQVAERMLTSLHEPYVVKGAEIFTSASIGIAISPEHGRTYDDLLSHADEAMYRAKSLGRNTYQVFNTESGSGTAAVDQLEGDLQHALERQELFILYQPYVELATNRVVGVEALLRWRHPVLGILEPKAFIPIAERSDVIVDIDSFVIRQTARQIRQWMDVGLPELRMSVNISGRDLLDPEFANTVIAALRDFSISPDSVEFEIMESVTVDGGGAVRGAMETLRGLGCRFSFDDFGTGSTSLARVASFPVTTVKIDRSFVQVLGPAAELNSLASAIIGMSEQLGLDCMAEGVETAHQRRILLARGCTMAQGDFFSSPMFPAEVERNLLGGEATSQNGATDNPVLASDGERAEGLVHSDDVELEIDFDPYLDSDEDGELSGPPPVSILRPNEDPAQAKESAKDFDLSLELDDDDPSSGPESVVLSDWEPLLLDHERDDADPHLRDLA